MDSAEKRFQDGGIVEVRLSSNIIKSILKVYSKIDDDLVMTFTPGGFSMHVDCKSKGKMFSAEFFADCLPVYTYKLFYRDGTPVEFYTIILNASAMLKLPIFKGGWKKVILHFYFSVNRRKEVEDKKIYFPTGQTCKSLSVTKDKNKDRVKLEYNKYFSNKPPNSKCFADIFSQLTTTSANDGVQSFEFGLLSTGKMGIFVKDYTESMKKKAERMNKKKTSKKESKNQDKLYTSFDRIDESSLVPKKEKDVDEEEVNVEYSITILKSESVLFGLLCKLNLMTTVQFYIAKDAPLAIKFPLDAIGTATFLYCDIKDDKMEVTPKKKQKKKEESESSSSSASSEESE